MFLVTPKHLLQLRRRMLIKYIVTVVLLLFVHAHVARDGQSSWPHFSLAGLDFLRGYPELCAYTVASN